MADKKKDRPVYADSDETLAAAEALAAAETPYAAYESKYGGLIDEAAKRILSGEKFSYDVAADPVYASMRESAERERRRAIKNAAASAAALTGGYGNSYGVTSGEEAAAKIYDSLNGVIPSLLDAAYKRWQGERNAELERLNVLMSLEDSDYGRYRDSVGDAKDERDYLYGKYTDLSARDRELYAAALDEYFKDRDYERRVYEDERDAKYRAERDSIEDALREREYELAYMKALSDAALNSAKIDTERAKQDKGQADTSSKKTDEGSQGSVTMSNVGNRFLELIANAAANGGEGSSLSGQLVDKIKKAKKDGRITTEEYDAIMNYARKVGFTDNDTGLLY